MKYMGLLSLVPVVLAFRIMVTMTGKPCLLKSRSCEKTYEKKSPLLIYLAERVCYNFRISFLK